MLSRIVGIEKVDYTSRNTGDRVRGTNLCYYTRADLCTTTRSIKIRESDAQIRLHIFC